MAYVQHKFKAMILLDPETAAETLLELFVKARANRRDAAKMLGCNERTFVKWAVELGVKAELARQEKLAIKEGWHHGKNRVGRASRKTVG